MIILNVRTGVIHKFGDITYKTAREILEINQNGYYQLRNGRPVKDWVPLNPTYINRIAEFADNA